MESGQLPADLSVSASDPLAPSSPLQVFASDTGESVQTIYLARKTSSNQTLPTFQEASQRVVLQASATTEVPLDWQGRELWVGAPGRAWKALTAGVAPSETQAMLDPGASLRIPGLPRPEGQWKWFVDLSRHSEAGQLTDRDSNLKVAFGQDGEGQALLEGLPSGRYSLTLWGGASRMRSQALADAQVQLFSGTLEDVEWWQRPEASVSAGSLLAGFRADVRGRSGLQLALTRETESGFGITARYSRRRARQHLDNGGIEWDIRELPEGRYRVELLPGIGAQSIEIVAGQEVQVQFGQALEAQLELQLSPSAGHLGDLDVLSLMARNTDGPGPWVRLPELAWSPAKSAYVTTSRLSPGVYEFDFQAKDLAPIAQALNVSTGQNLVVLDLVSQPGCVLEVQSSAVLSGADPDPWRGLVIRNSSGDVERPIILTDTSDPSVAQVHLDFPGTYTVQLGEPGSPSRTVTMGASERLLVVL